MIQVSRNTRFGDGPSCAQWRELGLEEGKTAAVQIRVRQRDGQVLNLNHQDMRIIGADIVLQHQSITLPRGRGVQTWVIQFERRCAVQTAHERADQSAIILLKQPDMSPVNFFASQIGGQVIDLLMQIHDQDMKAVSISSFAMHQAAQLRCIKLLASQVRQPVQPMLHTQVWLRIVGGRLQNRARHDDQIIVQTLKQALQIRYEQRIIQATCSRNQVRQPRC